MIFLGTISCIFIDYAFTFDVINIVPLADILCFFKANIDINSCQL